MKAPQRNQRPDGGIENAAAFDFALGGKRKHRRHFGADRYRQVPGGDGAVDVRGLPLAPWMKAPVRLVKFCENRANRLARNFLVRIGRDDFRPRPKHLRFAADAFLRATRQKKQRKYDGGDFSHLRED